LSTWALPRRNSFTKEVATSRKLWESLVKQRGIPLVEDYVTESHCKIQPTSLLPVCLARREGGRWSWNCTHFSRCV